MSETKKSRGKKPRISLEAVHRAFLDWLNGASLRGLKPKYGFSKDTYRYQFIKLYGKDYNKLPRTEGTYRILKDYLRSDVLTMKQKKHVRDFMEKNKEMIVQIDLTNIDTPLYTAKTLNGLTKEECSRTKNDYGYIFENMYSRHYQSFDEDLNPLYDEYGYEIEYEREYADINPYVH